MNNDSESGQPVLTEAAETLIEQLSNHGLRIVFAESCTGGLVAATMTRVPGVSSWFCGSAITYQEETKQAWLGIAPAIIAEFTAESEQVTAAMARQVLAKTPQAGIAVAVTGHLGPDAPASIDGVVYIACVDRESDVSTVRIELTQSDRVGRQIEATEAVLRFATQQILDQVG